MSVIKDTGNPPSRIDKEICRQIREEWEPDHESPTTEDLVEDLGLDMTPGAVYHHASGRCTHTFQPITAETKISLEECNDIRGYYNRGHSCIMIFKNLMDLDVSGRDAVYYHASGECRHQTENPPKSPFSSR